MSKQDLQQNVDVLALRRLTVLDETGEPVLFSKFWEDSNSDIELYRD